MRGTAAAVVPWRWWRRAGQPGRGWAGGRRGHGSPPRPPCPRSPGSGGDWPTAGFDLANSRAVAGAAITADRSGDLAPVWRAELTDAGTLSHGADRGRRRGLRAGRHRAVVGRRPRTGEALWTSEPTGFNIGPFGVAVDDDRVYALDGSVGVARPRPGRRRRSCGRPTSPPRRRPASTSSRWSPATSCSSARSRSASAASTPAATAGVVTRSTRTGEVALELRHRRGRRPVGQPRGQLRRRGLVPARRRRRARPRVRRRRQPGPVPRHRRVARTGRAGPATNLYTDSLVALDLATGALAGSTRSPPTTSSTAIRCTPARRARGRHDVVVARASPAWSSASIPTTAPRGGAPRSASTATTTSTDARRPDRGRAGHLRRRPHATGHGGRRGVRRRRQRAGEAVARRDRLLRRRRGQRDGEVVAVDAADGSVLWSTTGARDPARRRRRSSATWCSRRCSTATSSPSAATTATSCDTIDAGGGVNGWMAVAGDRLIVPVGMSDPPALLALGLPGE